MVFEIDIEDGLGRQLESLRRSGELGVEAMANILVIKERAERAQVALDDARSQEIQAQAARLAGYAQLGMWPAELAINKERWLPWARKDKPACWLLNKESNLAVTEEGSIGQLRGRRGYLEGAIFSVVAFLGGAAGIWTATLLGVPQEEWFSVDMLIVLGAIFLGMTAAEVGGAVIRWVMGGSPLAGIEKVEIGEVSKEQGHIMEAAERRALEIFEGYKRTIKAAEKDPGGTVFSNSTYEAREDGGGYKRP